MSSKQERFMRAAVYDKEFAKKVDVSQDVAKEFNDADKKPKGKLGKLYKGS